MNENQQLICKFENELKKLDQSSWYGKVNSPPKVKIDGKEYDFPSLYKLVREWPTDDKKYALETVFLPYLPKLVGGVSVKIKTGRSASIHLNKRLAYLNTSNKKVKSKSSFYTKISLPKNKLT